MEETHNMGRGGSMTLEQMGKKAKQAARVLASAGTVSYTHLRNAEQARDYFIKNNQ